MALGLKKRGFSMLEMVVYVTILATLFILVVNTILVVTGSYSSIKVSNTLNNSALMSLERLLLEIRNSKSINLGSSVFGTHPGRLVLNTGTTSPASIDFYIEDGQLKLKKDNVLTGSLTSDNVSVTNFVLTNTSSTTSSSVKIELTLNASEGDISKTEKFYASAVLRGSY